MKKQKKLLKIVACLIVVFLIILIIVAGKRKEDVELRSVKSEKELYSIYNHSYSDESDFFKILTFPIQIITGGFYYGGTIKRANLSTYDDLATNSSDIAIPNEASSSIKSGSSAKSESKTSSSSSTRDYSKTNIQVENVDEADITKTDGDYIYSISENNVVITDVRNVEDIKVVSKFQPEDSGAPVDLILNNKKLVVISQTGTYSSNTYVSIYEISDRKSPVLEKSYNVKAQYYTSRCINNKLYVISNGYLNSSSGEKKVDREYTEDSQTKEIPLENIKYINGFKNINKTIITTVDLNNPRSSIKINAYLIDVTNAYVSEYNIYLADYNWNYNSKTPSIWKLFGLKGVFGIADIDEDYYGTSKYETEIYKFEINGGDLQYIAKAKVDGQTINQYSMDEKNNHLRIATYDNEGTKISILDDKMNLIGETSKVAKGERMYSSRFIGNKAYLITYKQIDPLFVVDLSNESNPEILGELKISGYSAYLHPYDENHLIGIGMETNTVSNKDINGRVTSTSTRVVGMKMALFDVSDVLRPKTIATTIIGDSRTTSAILTNPKALLFSKEKQLLAIPVNNYSSDFETTDSTSLDTVISNYKNYSSSRIGEGYAVYKINLEDGFQLKGTITHPKTYSSSDPYSYYSYSSQMLRGIYIDNDLYTVSEDAIQVNNLETMKEINKVDIKNIKTTSNKRGPEKIQSTSYENNTIENEILTNELIANELLMEEE